MSISISNDKVINQAYDRSEWFDAKYYKFGLLPILGVAVFWVWFQRTYGYSVGLDSMEPEFDRIWMGLWRAHMIILPTVALIVWGYLWRTRNTAEQLSSLTPKQEIK